MITSYPMVSQLYEVSLPTKMLSPLWCIHPQLVDGIQISQYPGHQNLLGSTDLTLAQSTPMKSTRTPHVNRYKFKFYRQSIDWYTKTKKYVNCRNTFRPIANMECLNFSTACCHEFNCLPVYAGQLQDVPNCITWLTHKHIKLTYKVQWERSTMSSDIRRSIRIRIRSKSLRWIFNHEQHIGL